MRGKAMLLFVMLAMLSFSLVYASPVNIPTSISSKEGAFLSNEDRQNMGAGKEEEVDVSASFVFDNLSERKMKDYSAKAQANFFAGKLAVTLIDTFDIYALFGGMSNAEYKGIAADSDVKLNLEDKFMWGVGLSTIVYEWENSGFALFADGNYRSIQDIDLESATIDGTEYQKPDILDVSAKWQEWQFAFGVSKKFKYFIPYVGGKYSDVKAGAKATVSGTTYDAGNTKSKNKVGLFIGASIVPTKGIFIDLQGRFIDEQAFSVTATLKF